MQRFQPVQADDPVKLRQYTIQVVYDIVASVIDMAGIQANAQRSFSHRIHNGLQFLKPATDLAAFSGHGLQQHSDLAILCQCLLQGGRNTFHTGIHTLSHMAARVEIIEIPRQGIHPSQIIAQNLCRKSPGIRVCCAQIHGVCAVSNQRAKAFFLKHSSGPGRICRVNVFCLTAPGIAGKKGKGIRSKGQGRFNRGTVTAGGRKMTSEIRHGKHLFFSDIIPHFIAHCNSPHFLTHSRETCYNFFIFVGGGIPVKQAAPFPVTENNFPQCWTYIDKLRRKSRIMSLIARFGGFWTNLFFLFALLFAANGLIYSHFQGSYHRFLESLPLFSQVWTAVTSVVLRPGDSLTAEIIKLLLAVYGSSILLFVVLALLVALLYHPRSGNVPEDSFETGTSLLAKAAQEAWSKSYQTNISTSIFSMLLIIAAGFILLIAYTIFHGDAQEVEAMLSVFPTGNYETNCAIYTLIGYFICHIFSTVLFWLTRFIYRYQFPYDFMAQAETAALFAQEETEQLTPEEITSRRQERAATIREDAIALEKEVAYQKAKKMFHEAALLGDIPAMEHYARHCILSHLDSSARYWLERCIATGEASADAARMLRRLKLKLNHRVQYLRPDASPLTKKQIILRRVKTVFTVLWRIFVFLLLASIIALILMLIKHDFDPAFLKDLPEFLSRLLP